MHAMGLKTMSGTLVAGAALFAAGFSWTGPAQAQDRPPMGQGPGTGGPGSPGMMRIGPPPVMTASEKYVYILRGETLYQFSADGLKLLARSELPRPEPREFPDGKGPPRK